MTTPFLRTFVVTALLFLTSLHAQVPQLLNYQGRVAVDGVNFDGAGQFRFALVNAAGTTTYWSNDGTSTAGSQPTAAVALTVTKGLYSVLLGDATLANMTAVPASIFSNGDVRLRVWFDDGTNGSQLLTPDQRLAAVGYAIMAGNVADGVITASKIASGAVGATQLATGAIGATHLAANAVQATNVAAGQVVKSLNGFADAVTLSAGANITLSSSGNTITIANANPALASWAGSPNVITLGAVTTGTWNATALADAYIASAAAWNAKQTGDATLTTLSGKSTSGTGSIVLSQTPSLTNPLITGATDSFTIGNGGWFTTAVPYLRPTINGGIAFDIMPRGSAGGDCWIDICSTDVVSNSANFEDLDLKKKLNGPAYIGANAAGTGVVRDLMFQTQGGNIGVGALFSPTNGFFPASLMHLASNTNTDLSLSSAGTGAFAGLRAYHSRGTAAVPTASQGGDILLFVGTRGFGDNQYNLASDSGILFQASENFTNAAHGTTISLQTTTPATSTRVERLKVDVDVTVGTGHLVFATAGKGVQYKSGANARAGNATLVNGTVTVANTGVTANTLVMLSCKTPGGTLGFLSYEVTAGTSFTINSSSSTDGSVVSYQLIEAN
jgi:hypothetical protein